MSALNLPEVRGEYRFNFNLGPITWFKVGGNAQVFFKPEDIEDLQFFLKNLDKDIPVTVLGNCSNVIIRDGGIDGVVIKLGRNFANITQDENNNIITGCGALNNSVANFAMHNGRAKIEFLVGIPGTIGGGVRMNAGAYGTEFKDVLLSFKALDRNGNLIEFKSNEVEFEYRNCQLPADLIFIEATFVTENDRPENIKARMQQINEQRANTQPIKEKTSGSTFANPNAMKAWELIDKAGLRGFKIGGAEFSDKHCNFMINSGNATANDLEELGELAIKKVIENSGVKLKWEIRRIGKNA